jgi:hypothetical protein
MGLKLAAHARSGRTAEWIERRPMCIPDNQVCAALTSDAQLTPNHSSTPASRPPRKLRCRSDVRKTGYGSFCRAVQQGGPVTSAERRLCDQVDLRTPPCFGGSILPLRVNRRPRAAWNCQSHIRIEIYWARTTLILACGLRQRPVVPKLAFVS